MNIDSKLLAPGFSKKGIDGSRGETGDNGNCVYFTDYDLSDEYLMSLAKENIAKNQSISETVSLESHPYKTGDLFITGSDRRVFRLTKTDNVDFEELGGIINLKMTNICDFNAVRVWMENSTKNESHNTSKGKSMDVSLNVLFLSTNETSDMNDFYISFIISIPSYIHKCYGLQQEGTYAGMVYKSIEIPMEMDDVPNKYKGHVKLQDWVCDKLYFDNNYNAGIFYDSSNEKFYDASIKGYNYLVEELNSSYYSDFKSKVSFDNNRSGETAYFSAITETDTSGAFATFNRFKEIITESNKQHQVTRINIFKVKFVNKTTGETFYKEMPSKKIIFN